MNHKTTRVEKNVVIETTTRPLDEYEFHCPQCQKVHKKGAYAIAQEAMGHRVVFTCDCGNEITL